MNDIQQGILTLIKSAVLQQKLQLPETFDIGNAGDLIRRHQLVTLVYDGCVRCQIPMQQLRMQHLFRGYCKALQISERQMKDLNRIYAAFEENGIDYMPLKGSNMKLRYPKPEFRLMGDADILIRLDQYGKIIPIMESLGFAAQDETDHEYVWKSDGLFLELHKRIIPSYNKDYYRYFGDGWQLAVHASGTRYAMSLEDEFLYLFTHFAKHFRDGGIGCRHVVDLWLYLRTYPGLNVAYIKEELQKLQLEEFYENISRLIGVWFDAQEGDAKTELISEFIFASGSFGQDVSRALSLAVRDSGKSALGSGRVRYLWQTAFPSAAVLRRKYPVLKQHPRILPLIWAVRPLQKVLFEAKDLKMQKDNVEILSKENLEERRQMMEYLGITYHF